MPPTPSTRKERDLKPRNFRYAQLAAPDGTVDSTSLAPDRLLSLLIHENQNLRALVEGKGRITADRDLQAEVERLKQQTADLQHQLRTVRADRNRLHGQEARFQSSMSELRRLVNDQQASVSRSIDDLVQRVKATDQEVENQAERQRTLASEQTKSEKLEQVEKRQRETIRSQELTIARLAEDSARLQQSKRDMHRLLDRLSTFPLGPLLRTRAGFREIESRWRS